MGAGQSYHARSGDALGRARVDVQNLPVHLPGRPAAAIPAHHPAALPPEHEVKLCYWQHARLTISVCIKPVLHIDMAMLLTSQRAFTLSLEIACQSNWHFCVL